MSTPLEPMSQTALASYPDNNLFLHVAIWADGAAPIGPDLFRMVSFQGQEGISQPFEYQLELHANTDPQQGMTLQFDQLIGKPVTVGINLPSAGDQGERRFSQAIRSGSAPQLSLFNGIIVSFAMSEPGVYQATMKPALFKLTLSNHYRVLRNCNIRDAIKQVLAGHSIVQVDFSALTQSSNPALNRRQDWLQAGESDFEFIQRLMGKAHLYYFFRHDGLSHTLVFANHAGYPQVHPDGRKLRYTSTSIDALGAEQDDLITQYQYQQSLTSSSVNAVFTTPQVASADATVAGYTSYHAETMPISASNSVTGRDKGQLPYHLYRIYPYGGSEQEVSTHASEQAHMASTGGTTFSGSSQCALFRVGYQFSVSGEQGAGVQPELVRPSLDGHAFVLTSVQHKCSQDGTYSNEFQSTGVDGNTLITPFALQDTHQGTILAQVVAHGSGRQPTDWRYYNKDAFSPNSYSPSDSTATPSSQSFSGVYVLFSTERADGTPVWVRLAPHMQTVPEVGSLVLISRSNDEGEVPEIQSIIQNNGTLVVTPGDWTANSHVGNSYSTSFSDSKGVRFPFGNSGADLSQAKATVDLRYSNGSLLAASKFAGQVFKDVSYSIGGSWGYSTAIGGRSGMLGESHSVGCNYSKSEGEETRSWTDYDLAWSQSTHHNVESYSTISVKQYSESTVKDSESISHITGYNTSTQTIDGATTSTTTHNGSVASTATYNDTVSNTGDHYKTVSSDTTYHSGANVSNVATHHDKVSSTTTHHEPVTSDTTYKSSATVTSTTTHNAKVTSTTTHNGSVYSTTNVTGSQVSNSTIGASSSSSAIGASNNNSVVGVSNSNSLEGLHNTNSLTGAMLNNSIVGATTGLNLTGRNASLSITGVDTSVSLTGSGISVQLRGNSEILMKVDELEAKLPALKAKLLTGIMSVI